MTERRHDHTCSDECAASEEHMRAMDDDAWRQIAELEANGHTNGHTSEVGSPHEDEG